jgi:hypothetical protein
MSNGITLISWMGFQRVIMRGFWRRFEIPRLFKKEITRCAHCPNCASYAADRFYCKMHTKKYANIRNNEDYHLIPDIRGEIPGWCELEKLRK